MGTMCECQVSADRNDGVKGVKGSLNPAELLARDFDDIVQASNHVLNDPDERRRRAVPGQTYFLPDGRVLTFERRFGDSRYPLGHGGYNFWAYSSGVMHCNDGIYSIFLKPSEGSEPNIAFFGGIKGKGHPISLLSVPHVDVGAGLLENLRRFQVFCGNASYYVVDSSDIRYGVRVFVNHDNAICFSLSVSNLSDSTQECFISSYLNPFMRHQIYESDEDRWFKQVEVQPGEKLPAFLVSVNEDEDRYHSITNYGVVQRGFIGSEGAELVGSEETTSRDQYVGYTRRSLHSPLSLINGGFGGDSSEAQKKTTFVTNAIAGDLINLKLKGGAHARVDLIFRCERDEASARKSLSASINLEQVDHEIRRIEHEDAQRQKGINWHVSGGGTRLSPEVFNVFAGHLKRQIEFCSLIKGYVQLSVNSLIGIRDVFQALEALSFWQPEVASKKMLEALNYMAPDGRCFRQYSCPSASGEMGRMDLRPFIDQGVWVISTITTYLKLTGDWKFLSVNCGYHEIVSEHRREVKKSEQRDSVLEHLVKILDFLLKNRDSETKCVLALYGDWNDALDGLGITKDPNKEYGTGVSVMATLQVYQNLDEMIEILKRVDNKKFSDQISFYEKVADEIALGLEQYAVVSAPSNSQATGESKILHGWGDQRSYFVGSYSDPDGQSRDALTSNAFWVLSGLWGRDSSPEMKKVILDAFDRLDSTYGLKTFHPAFPPNSKGVGRIGKLPAGTAENAAVYIHASLFGIQALFKLGEPERAWEQLYKVLPFTDLHQNLSHSPFVMPNSYGCNPDKFIAGQSMNDWQTGSSNVLMKLLIRDVFGFEPEFEQVWLHPAKYFPFDRFEFKINFRGCEFVVEYENRGSGQRTFEREGKRVEGVLDPVLGTVKLSIPYDGLGRKVHIRVVD